MRCNVFYERMLDRFPASTPLPWGNTRGPITPETLDWAGKDVDPLFWDDGKEAVGSDVLGSLDMGPKRDTPTNSYHFTRVLRRITDNGRTLSFRVVIGPDLVKERKQKPPAK